MDPGIQPAYLQSLTQIEELLIARANPIMCVYTKHGGQYRYKGNVVNVPQDVQSFVNPLPRQTQDVPVIVVRRKWAEDTFKDFQVRRCKVLDALIWPTTPFT